MPKLTGSLGFVNLDIAAINASLDQKLTKILIEGTVEWVRTVSAIIPNWSGMSRASLRPIAELVNIPIFASAVAGAPDRTGEGEAAGSGELHAGPGQYFFSWKSNVFHLAYNEKNNANLVGFHLRNPGPYESMRQAQQSFYRTVNPKLRALDPELAKFIGVIRKSI